MNNLDTDNTFNKNNIHQINNSNISDEISPVQDVIMKNDDQINKKLLITGKQKNYAETKVENENEYFNELKNYPKAENVDDLDEIFLESDGETVYHCHPKNRSLWDRYFGEVRKGSLRGSTFSMITVALGSGVLAIPVAFKVMSVGFAIFSLLFCGFNLLMNMYFLSSVANKVKCYEYGKLLTEVGGKTWALVYNWSTVIYLFGALIAYQVIIYRMICTVIFDFTYTGPLPLEKYLDEGVMTKAGYKWGINFGIALVVLFPLSLVKEMSKFRVTSLLGIFSTVYIILVKF